MSRRKTRELVLIPVHAREDYLRVVCRTDARPQIREISQHSRSKFQASEEQWVLTSPVLQVKCYRAPPDATARSFPSSFR